MIYITGDCHGNFERFNTDIFPEQLEMNKEDYVIICGDFGGIWDKSGDSKKEAMILNQLECKSYTTFECNRLSEILWVHSIRGKN